MAENVRTGECMSFVEYVNGCASLEWVETWQKMALSLKNQTVKRTVVDKYGRIIRETILSDSDEIHWGE